MDFNQRQTSFIEAVKKKVGADKSWQVRELFGVSNKAMLVEGALQIGASNLDTLFPLPPGIIFASALRFPPADEIYFAIIVRQDCDKLLQRLQDMKQKGTILQAILKENKAKYQSGSRSRPGARSGARNDQAQKTLFSGSEEYTSASEESDEEVINPADVPGIDSDIDNNGKALYRERNNTVRSE